MKTRVFKEANNFTFKSLIGRENWSGVYSENDADARYEKFCEVYTKLYDVVREY